MESQGSESQEAEKTKTTGSHEAGKEENKTQESQESHAESHAESQAEKNETKTKTQAQVQAQAQAQARITTAQQAPPKPIGKTPNGKSFIVPQTHDMVSQLFSPSQPKNLSDLLVVFVLGLHILVVYLLPENLRYPLCAATFIFWRACYNAGIGYLLHLQSQDRRLVSWARRSKIFTNPKLGENKHPWLYAFLKREMETKIVDDYHFESAPLEYNTWLLFRRLVDLILMCDFVTYCLFAIVNGGRPAGESYAVTVLRWSAGLSLFFFNLWVKLDAHRVVKDYAWYWGDFFYLIDQELTFDGVFEMAPHPMYSIGYAGYYGISLMAASYSVLAISILAHAAQFAFLFWVENPHIEKTYNMAPRKRSPRSSNTPPLDTHPVHNLDLHRVTDSSVLLLQFYMFSLMVLTPSTPMYQAIFLVNATLWRLWYSVGIGYLLDRQSRKKRWTRHFLKYGESSEEAWRQWKGLYHIAMTMCYASFIAACWKMYSFPEWNHALAIKHIVGTGLVCLQLWTAFSIYASLGEFGWFFGDFFFDSQSQLTYSGIYRFLNNPERLIGIAGVWGAALITSSTAIFCLALLSHILALAFIQLVERPHMQKLYGQSLRRESGFTKSLKRSLPPHILQLRGSVDRIMEGTLDSIEEFLDATRPRISHLVQDTSTFLKKPRRVVISRRASDMRGYNPAEYSLELEQDKFEYGTPVKVKWTAPAHHSRKDWIGLYMLADNHSRKVTHVSSQGRWIATNRHQYDDTSGVGLLLDGGSHGEVEFSGDKLWWQRGTFELRYHHDGSHNVMAISSSFKIDLFSDNLLSLVRNCFDRDDDIAPSTMDESFGPRVERDVKYAKRVVYAVQQVHGIEFAPEVVQVDGNVRNLAWRVDNARKDLAL